VRRAWTTLRAGAATFAVVFAVVGCGLNVQSADLFALTRTGQGTTLTLLVNDGGTIRCDGAKAKPLNDALLIQARDLADNLAGDAGKNLALPAGPGTVFTYRIKLQQGTVTFSDRDTAHHPILAQTELFTAQVAQQACGLN
jgi:hypothetical protein